MVGAILAMFFSATAFWLSYMTNSSPFMITNGVIFIIGCALLVFELRIVRKW